MSSSWQLSRRRWKPAAMLKERAEARGKPGVALALPCDFTINGIHAHKVEEPAQCWLRKFTCPLVFAGDFQQVGDASSYGDQVEVRFSSRFPPAGAGTRTPSVATSSSVEHRPGDQFPLCSPPAEVGKRTPSLASSSALEEQAGDQVQPQFQPAGVGPTAAADSGRQPTDNSQ